MINPKKENFLCKKCRHIWNFEYVWGEHLRTYPEEKDKVLKNHLCIDCSLSEEERKTRVSLKPSDATFYCPNCKIYTNDKTHITTCVYCNTSLIRTNHQVIDYV